MSKDYSMALRLVGRAAATCTQRALDWDFVEL